MLSLLLVMWVLLFCALAFSAIDYMGNRSFIKTVLIDILPP
jgi:hypothetical protein